MKEGDSGGNEPLLSVNLVTASQRHIRFLAAMHKIGVSLQTPSPASLRRYADLWLPLLAAESGSDRELIPPPDIAWLWHCHRLAPAHYLQYVKTHFGTNTGMTLEAKPAFTFQTENGSTLFENDDETSDVAHQTVCCWQSRYPDMPFWIDINDEQNDRENKPQPIASFPCLDGYDLVAACKRQAKFLYQLSRPQFLKTDFLEQAVQQYIRFLQLPTHHGPIVPTYQIDLMWHTHMLASLEKYSEDCLKIRGPSSKPLNHDDSEEDRSQDSTLSAAFQETRKLWAATYGGEEYNVEGTLYRGEPPSDFYNVHWDPFSSSDCGSPSGQRTAQPVEKSPSAQYTHRSKKQIQWVSLNESGALDGQPPFLAERPSKINKYHEESYIEGQGPIGLGFYHIYTKESYKILLRQLQQKEESAFTMFMSFEVDESKRRWNWSNRTGRNEIRREQLKQAWLDIRYDRACVQAQLMTDGPCADVDLKVVEKIARDGERTQAECNQNNVSTSCNDWTGFDAGIFAFEMTFLGTDGWGESEGKCIGIIFRNPPSFSHIVLCSLLPRRCLLP